MERKKVRKTVVTQLSENIQLQVIVKMFQCKDKMEKQDEEIQPELMWWGSSFNLELCRSFSQDIK